MTALRLGKRQKLLRNSSSQNARATTFAIFIGLNLYSSTFVVSE